MAKKVGTTKAPPKDCKDCENWGEVSKRIRVHELLESTLLQFEKKIKENKYEPTVAEYLKLLQLGQELGREHEAKEIKVTWVTPDAASEPEK
jgi:hypothetical protein